MRVRRAQRPVRLTARPCDPDTQGLAFDPLHQVERLPATPIADASSPAP